MEIQTKPDSHAVTPPVPKSVRRHIEYLSGRSFKGAWDQFPKCLPRLQLDCCRTMLDEIEQTYVPIAREESFSLTSDVQLFYWDDQLDQDTLLRIQNIWYEALKEYSHATLHAVAMDWLKNAKRRPTPADFLELASAIDPVPKRRERLLRLAALPVEEDQPKPKDKLVGCPIVLAKLMTFAAGVGLPFEEKEQIAYLATGNLPGWYRPKEEEVVALAGMPTREELLATMTPEARVLALKGKEDWNGGQR